MRELSIFVDESGDWGEYSSHSPYYIITFVFHNQDVDLTEDLEKLDRELVNIGFSGQCLHTGPIIRGEENYRQIELRDRQKILRKMMGFIRKMNISYKSFYIEKRQFDNSLDAVGRLSKKLAFFIKEHYMLLFEYDVIKVYYDNGQIEVNKILSSVFNALLDNVVFKKVLPKDYRLFQVADFLCMMTLIELKKNNKSLSKSEILFFESERVLTKQYLKRIKEKELE